MRIDRKQKKAEARLAMRESRPSIYVTALVFLAILFVLNLLTTRLQYPGLSVEKLMAAADDSDKLNELLLFSQMRRGTVSRLLELAIALLMTVLEMGFTGVCLWVSRRIASGIGDLFEPFGFFLKVLWLNIVTGVFMALWSLLLVVPGIVAAYRYSMAPYVLLHNPSKSVMDCIRESKELTRGHKGELFVLDLSFLGWALLSAIPFVSIFTVPYMTVTKAGYFNDLSGFRAEPTETEPPRDGGAWY